MGKDGRIFTHVNGSRKKTNIAVFKSDKTDFKIKVIIRDKEGCYVLKENNAVGEGNNFKYLCIQNGTT